MKAKTYVILRLEGKSEENVLEYQSIKFMIRKGFFSRTDEVDFGLKKKWTPGDQERVFFFSGCAVPRFKVREKFKVTIKPENATALFMSPKGLQATTNLIETSRLGHLYATDVLQFMVNIYGRYSFQTTKFKSIIEHAEPFVLISYEDYERLFARGPNDAIFPPQRTSLEYVTSDQSMAPRVYTFQNNRMGTFYLPLPELEKYKDHLYDQDAILGILNSDKLIIDEKRYQDMRLMGGTTSKDDIILLMEIMANANYEKSFVYLLLLLAEFKTKIQNQKVEVQHVNFRSLLEYFGLDARTLHNITIENLTETMRKLGQFTRSNIQRVTQFFGTDKAHNFTSSTWLTGPVLRPEIEKELDDFVSDHDQIELEDD